jgi:cell division GTPase FtsZ
MRSTALKSRPVAYKGTKHAQISSAVDGFHRIFIVSGFGGGGGK